MSANRPTHILFLQSSSDLYGSDRCLINVASGLLDKGYKVSAVLPYEGPLVGELAAAGVKTWLLEPLVFRKQLLAGPAETAKFLWSVPGSVRALKKLMRQEKVDIVHSNTGVVIGGALASRSCGLPHVWHFREVFSEFKKAWRWYEPFVSRHSARIVCISEAVRNQFVSDTARGKSVIVYDGVTMPLIEESRLQGPGAEGDDNQAARDHDTFNIICSGRINPPFKGQDILVEATRKLIDMGIPARTALVGDVFPGKENLSEDLKSLIAALELEDYVTMAGFREDVTSWIDDCDVAVIPSKHPEPFGIVVLEAFARGKPVVGSKIGGIPEMITDGENGLLVPPADPGALAQALEKLYRDRDLGRRLARSGWKTVRDVFSPEQAVDQLSGIYQEILAAKN